MKGKVLWYDVSKGYGFIRGNDGGDVFVHRSQLPFWTIYLTKGDRVEYEIEHSVRGNRATALEILKVAS